MNKEEFLDIVKDVSNRKKQAMAECRSICLDLNATLEDERKKYIKDNAKFKVGDQITYKIGKKRTFFDVVAGFKTTDTGNIKCLTLVGRVNQDDVQEASAEDVKFWLPHAIEQARFKVGDEVTMRGKRTFKIKRIGFALGPYGSFSGPYVRYITEEGEVFGDGPYLTLVEKVQV